MCFSGCWTSRWSALVSTLGKPLSARQSSIIRIPVRSVHVVVSASCFWVWLNATHRVVGSVLPLGVSVFFLVFSHRTQGGRLALGPFRVSKLGVALLSAHLFGRNGSLWEVRGIEISMREPDVEPFSWLEPLFFLDLKTSKLECAKII